MTDTILDVRVVVFRLHEDALEVLLMPSEVKRAKELPGTPVQADESLEDAAARAIACQVDRRQAYLEQLYTYGDPERAPRRVISVIYFALVPAGALHPSSGTKSWERVDALPRLAYDHAEIVAYALRRLRYKLEYSAVGFQLLPEEFTLTTLQHTYELILGEALDKRNFRRRILEAGIIEETPHMRTGEGRPARLYRYRPDAVAEVKARRLFP
jgi:8-oxo-dGTP diphosphatase